jgi:hypothetical protein
MTIKIQPKENYRCAVYSRPALDKTKTYKGYIAFNQPDYKEKGLVFCKDYLLKKGEYKIIKEQNNE